MPSREMSLMELWQTCRACEDSCRRMADVLGAAMRGVDGGVLPQRITVTAELPELWPIPEPDPPCVPPFCQINYSTMGAKAELLARRVAVLVDAVHTLRDQDPDRVITFYTSVPGGSGTPLK